MPFPLSPTVQYTPVKPIQYSNSSPFLVTNQIDSVHDLHSFFFALLARSNRTPTVYTPSDGPETECINRLFPHRAEPTLRKNADGRGRTKLRKNNKLSTNEPKNKNSRLNESSAGVSVENVSLEELFLNIDRIIANDFLETLSTVEN